MKILVTGASGFIGSYIVEEALRQGMETWAAVRPTSPESICKTNVSILSISIFLQRKSWRKNSPRTSSTI